MIAVDNTVVGKRKYSLNDDVTRMLFVGHLSEEKGVYLVLEALHKLVSESPRNFHLDIVGGGSESEVNRLNSEIKKLGVEPFVSYVGHVSSKQELVNRFNAADVFVYPSYFQEGFPRVVYEAMLMGLPIICTILVGMRDFMEDKKNCIEVEPLDVNSLIDAIKQTDNEEYRKNLGLNAKRDVLEYLSQFKGATHAEQVLALIERGG